MSELTDIAGAIAGGAAGANPVSAIAGLADDIFNAIFPSPEKKAAAEAAGIKAQVDAYVAKAQVDMQGYMAQIDVDKAEAANSNWFVAGWRPAVGWICAAGLGWQFLAAPFLTWIATLIGHPTTIQPLNGDLLQTCLFGMLGLGAMRTVEHVTGSATQAVSFPWSKKAS
jgi:hypothetical protein